MSIYLAGYFSSNEIRAKYGWKLGLIYKIAHDDKWRKAKVGRRTYYDALDVASSSARRDLTK